MWIIFYEQKQSSGGVLWKGFLRNFVKFTGKHLRQSLFFNKVAGLRPATLLKKETLAQVFSCEFYEISKNNFFYRTPPVAASVWARLKSMGNSLMVRAGQPGFEKPIYYLSQLIFTPSENIWKPILFWWFLAEQKLSNPLKFAKSKYWGNENLATIFWGYQIIRCSPSFSWSNTFL